MPELLIGVNCDVGVSGEKTRAQVIVAYLDYIAAAGMVPLLIPPLRGPEQELALSLVDRVHGFVFIGGDDYRFPFESEPEGFEPVHERRETFDLALVDRVVDLELPFLAICGGFQLVVAARGGTLIGHLRDGSVKHRREHPDQPLEIHVIDWLESDAALSLEAREYRVNSHHHQAVATLPNHWKVLAHSRDRVIEAAKGPGQFQLGVQWHPEREVDTVTSRALIQGLKLHAETRLKRVPPSHSQSLV